jgi:hypothetical protein
VRWIVAITFIMLAACVPDSARDVAIDRRAATSTTSLAADASHRARPGYVVDSILPVEEELRRFRAGLSERPAVLSGGAPSREALVRRFLHALAGADTSALRAMLLSRAEFAYLVYPTSPYSRAPYHQPPGLVWMGLQRSTAQGAPRLLERARGYRYLGHACDPQPEREGENRLWRHCRVRVEREPGDTTRMMLFGVIVERDERFKFASYETDF